RLLHELDRATALVFEGLQLAAAAAIRIGELDLAHRMMMRPLLNHLRDVVVRLNPELHPLLDREPFAPRRLDATLVWPLEAPMMSPSVFALFRDVRIESGRP